MSIGTLAVAGDGSPTVTMAKPDSPKFVFITPNWCDKTTWHPGSKYVASEVATDDGDQLSYSLLHQNVIDSYHGKIAIEDYLKDSQGRSFRVVVKVNDVARVEQDPTVGSGGDYTVNYAAGKIVFLSALQPGDVVTVEYHYASSSSYSFIPASGKTLTVNKIKMQISEDIEVRDTLVLQSYAQISQQPGVFGQPVVTGNPFDLAIEGDGFFPIHLPDGSMAYTRDGSFKTNESGQVVTVVDGYPLEPAITVPSDMLAILFGTDGAVTVTLSDQSQVVIGNLQLARFANPAGLEPMPAPQGLLRAGRLKALDDPSGLSGSTAPPNNLFIETASSGAPITGTPGVDGFGSILQGALEKSKVRVVVYKTLNDLLADASQVHSCLALGGEGWRALKAARIFTWDCVELNLHATYGMEVRIGLQHETAHAGSFATATFYCTSADETQAVLQTPQDILSLLR